MLRGKSLNELVEGKDVWASETMMVKLCKDLSKMNPPKFARAVRSSSGKFLMTVIGKTSNN